MMVFSLVLVVGPGWAAAQGTVAERYKQARELLSEAPKQAYELAMGLEPLAGVDELRVGLLADAAMAAGMTDEAIELLEAFARATPDDGHAFRARLDRAELLLLVGKGDEALSLAQSLRGSKIGGRRVERRFFLSRLMRLQHDIYASRSDDKGAQARAKSLARDLIKGYPAEAATKRAGLLVSVEDLSDAERFGRAKTLFDTWDYHGAREEFERLYKDAKYQRESRWFLAEIALNRLRDRPKEAEGYFAELAKIGPKQEESLYLLARSQMRQERYDDALKTMDRYLAAYPRGTHVQVIHYYGGWLHYDHRDNERAIVGFRAYMDRYGYRSRHSSYVLGFWAWAHMRLGQWKEAVGVWEQMRRYGNTLVEGKALYWQAYALEKLGEQKDAQARLNVLKSRYSVSYYGMLGEQLRAKINGEDARASQVWWPEGSGTANDRPRKRIDEFPIAGLNAAQKKSWERVRILVELDEREHARDALKPIYERLIALVPAAERDQWIHALGYYVGDYNRMWQLATGGSISAMPAVPDPKALRTVMAYPRAYKDIVLSTTGEFDLPPELMWSIMRQESRYKP
ncbi:MAG: tetratricopeptide repeat protein, partial [Bradymonadaceae bacterium]|nr:tetratricopeptide repeat protein [Lujinxingiaceae bacterium]